MSNVKEAAADDIVFVVGTGNQSAICGGTKPIKVIDPKTDAHATDPNPPGKGSDVAAGDAG